MTANQFRAALKSLGLTQAGASGLFRVDERTGRRWAEQGLSGPAAILMRLLVEREITVAQIERARD
jgi:hypothetical protein